MRKMGPIAETHPCVGTLCAVCTVPIKAGDFVTLFSRGPDPDDDEEAEKTAAGRPYIAVASLIHWDCMPDLGRTALEER